MIKKIAKLNRFFLLFIFVCLLASFWACSGGGGGGGEEAKKEEPTPTPLPTPVDPDKQPLFDKVYLRTDHDTFNEKYYFALREGKIWAKSRTEGSKWALINGEGTPVINDKFIPYDELKNAVVEMIKWFFTGPKAPQQLDNAKSPGDSGSNPILEFISKFLPMIPASDEKYKSEADRVAKQGHFFTVDEVKNQKIVGLTVDYSDAIAVTDQGAYIHSVHMLDNVFGKDMDWRVKWGWPFDAGPGMNQLPGARSWGMSNDNVGRNRFYRDMNGHLHCVLVTGVYALSENGQELHFCDPWTTSDWGYQVAGPNRGAFVSEKMAVAASTMMLINKYGDIYSLQSDFDIGGGNPGFIFSYEDNTCIAVDPEPGDDIRWALANTTCYRRVPDNKHWLQHPKIKGKITDLISLHFPEDGQPGSIDRIMRVEGMDDKGNLGYYEKRLLSDEKHYIADNNWVFHAIPGWKNQGKWLDNRPEDCSTLPDVNKPPKENNLTGQMTKPFSKDKIQIKLENFSMVAEPALIKVNVEGDNWITLKLHHHFYLRTNINDKPGLDGKPIIMGGQIEVPEEVMETDNQKVKTLLKDYFNIDATSVKKGQRFVNLRVFPTAFFDNGPITTGILASPDSVTIKPEMWGHPTCVSIPFTQYNVCLPSAPIPSGVELKFGK